MSTVRQLFHLQELDSEIARVAKEVSSIETRIGDRSPLTKIEADLQSAQDRHRTLQTDHSESEMQAAAVRDKLRQGQEKMYGGTVTNVRELEGLADESALLEADLQKREEALLQLMEQIEESSTTLADAERLNATAQAQWNSNQEALTDQWQQLGESLEQLEAQRKETAQSLPAVELNRYEALRTSKQGLAVARVERGLCRGCLMTLPTHQMQKARMAREPVTCNSCGRLLFVS